MIVDAYAQVFAPVSDAYPRAAGEVIPADDDATIKRLRNAMTASDVDAAVLVPADHHDRYVAEVLADDPDRFAAIAIASATVQGRAGLDPVDTFRMRHELFPFHALQTSWIGDPDRGVGESPFFPVLKRLCDAGMPLWTYLPESQLPLIADLVATLPDLTVVLCHLGSVCGQVSVDGHGRPRIYDPFPTPTLEMLRRFGDIESINVVASTQYALSRNQPPYIDLASVHDSLMSWFGPERMLWGSGFPWIDEEPGYSVAVDLPSQVFPQLTEQRLAQVRGGTVARLFPHLAAATHADTTAC